VGGVTGRVVLTPATVSAEFIVGNGSNQILKLKLKLQLSIKGTLTYPLNS
jgi:hypothetical protein